MLSQKQSGGRYTRINSPVLKSSTNCENSFLFCSLDIDSGLILRSSRSHAWNSSALVKILFLASQRPATSWPVGRGTYSCSVITPYFPQCAEELADFFYTKRKNARQSRPDIHESKVKQTAHTSFFFSFLSLFFCSFLSRDALLRLFFFLSFLFLDERSLSESESESDERERERLLRFRSGDLDREREPDRSLRLRGEQDRERECERRLLRPVSLSLSLSLSLSRSSLVLSLSLSSRW